MRTTACKFCNAQITWAISPNGKKIPLDAEPTAGPTGREPVYDLQESNREIYAIRVSQEDINSGVMYHKCHFSTCTRTSNRK